MRRCLLCYVLILTAAGCKTTTTGGAGDSRPDAEDPALVAEPCADRLHDIGGALLVYVSQHDQLPSRLSDLAALDRFGLLKDTTCPVSHKQYTYVPGGISTPKLSGTIYAYDSTPAHNNARLAVMLVFPTNGKAPYSKVISLPDSFFDMKIRTDK